MTELEALRRSLAEAAEQQRVTREILRTIAATPTELGQLFDTIARSAGTLCRGESAAVVRFDGEVGRVAGFWNLRPEAEEVLRAMYPIRPGTGSSVSRVLLEKRMAHVPDALLDPAYTSSEKAIAAVKAIGFRAVVTVPMLHRDGTLVGAISVAKAVPGPFSDSQISVLETFADQAVIAIENARLLIELERKTRDLETASQEKAEFLANLLREIRAPLGDVLGIAGLGTIESLSARLLELVLAQGSATRAILFLPRDEDWAIAAERAADGATAVEPGTHDAILLRAAAERREPVVVEAPVPCVAVLPLIHAGRLGGLLYLENDRRTGAFGEDRLELLGLLSTQAAISIENAALYAQLERKVETRTEELRGAREEARDERLKSAFLTTMNHELRTPLAAVLGLSELLLAAPLGPDERGFVETIRKSGKDLLTLVDDTLELSRLLAGELASAPAAFVLDDALELAVGLFAKAAREKGLELSLAIAPGVPREVVADAARLRQIVARLLRNAVEFTEAGAIGVAVRAERQGGDALRLEVAVSDTGVGIPEDERAKLFRPFVQIDSTLTRRHGGSGIGLAISKLLVEGLGGRIDVESEGVPGKGSTFRFTVAATGADATAEAGRRRTWSRRAETRRPAAAAAGEPAALGDAPAPALRVLVAEDNAVNRTIALAQLRRLGLAADVVGDGAQALEALRRQPYDLVLMDVQMPVMDGLEATRRIRAELPDDRRPRILAVSANVEDDDREACRRAGMDDFLGKPFTADGLRRALERLGIEVAGASPPTREGGADPLDHDALAEIAGTSVSAESARELEELVQVFESEGRSRVALLRDAAAAADADRVRREAHALKGASRSIGAREVARLSVELERLGRAGALAETAAPLVRQLGIELDRAVGALRHELGARFS